MTEIRHIVLDVGKVLVHYDPEQGYTDLIPDPKTLSGFRWSTPAGPPYRIDSQILVTGAVHLPSKRPIDWVV